MEVNSLSYRITSIYQAFCNTSHVGLRERLIYENRIIYERINEIFAIAKALKIRNNEKISFSGLLAEQCERTLNQKRLEKDLFFL